MNWFLLGICLLMLVALAPVIERLLYELFSGIYHAIFDDG